MDGAKRGTACSLLAVVFFVASCSRVGWIDKVTPEKALTLTYIVRNNLPAALAIACVALIFLAIGFWRSSRK